MEEQANTKKLPTKKDRSQYNRELSKQEKAAFVRELSKCETKVGLRALRLIFTGADT